MKIIINKIKLYFTSVGYASKIIFAASKKYFISEMALTFLFTLLPYLPMFLWKELINSLTNAMEYGAEPLVKKIWFLVFCYAAVMLTEKLLVTISDFISFKYNDAIQYYLDNLMVDRVSSVDLAFFDSSDMKDKLNNSWSLVYSMKKMVSLIFEMIQKSTRLVLSFGLMLMFEWRLIPIVIIFCIPAVIGNKQANQLNYRFEKEHTKSARKLEYLKDLFSESSRQEIRLYHLTGYFTLLYNNVWFYWDKAMHAKNLRICLINAGTFFLLSINEAMVYVLCLIRLSKRQIAVGDVAYYVSLLTQFRTDFTTLCNKINSFDRNSKEIEDVRSFIEMKPILEKSGTKIPSANPTIEFDDVSFRYPNSDHNVLSHCTFTINPGETVGLVGLNGSGKSTIVKLLCRFYDPTDGEIRIDGISAKEYDIIKLRELFGVLFQDYQKYCFTLRENIALSNLSEMNNTDAIYNACIKSKVYDFAGKWEKGIDENLLRNFDPNGKNLSGGQWQRISLARAYFRNAPVVLLDEPSAALDPVAEHEIFENYTKIYKGKSAVLISHRLSGIKLCDKILVLENGHIIEQGTHSELIKQGGKYAELFILQASKYA